MVGPQPQAQSVTSVKQNDMLGKLYEFRCFVSENVDLKLKTKETS